MTPKLTTERLFMRTPMPTDAEIIVEFEKKNESHFKPWRSTAGMFCLKTWEERLQIWQQEYREERSIRFLVFTNTGQCPLIGCCNFTQIFRGPFQACYLGYRIDKDFEGQGLMHEALAKAISYLFEELNLHRIMASYMPVNERSAKLLQRLGFVREGFAKEYLLINDRWEDHVLTALTNQKWRAL